MAYHPSDITILSILVLTGIVWLIRQGFIRIFRIGQAIKIDDGDTFTLLRKHLPGVRIRIAWMDAPEFTQPFGPEARTALRNLIKNRLIRVTFVDTDRYGRRVAQVRCDGTDVGLMMIKEGFAWSCPGQSPGQSWLSAAAYAKAQRTARRLRKGLWQDKRPEAPWKYRHRPWLSRLIRRLKSRPAR